MSAETLTAPEAGSRFSQRLAPEVFDRIQARVRERMAEQGFTSLLTDDPEDVAYLTGFFHHPGERPVAVLLPLDGPVTLLVPQLEVQHAEEQNSRAQIVSFAEYPGVENPFAPLARAAGDLGARPGVTTLLTLHRLNLLRQAFGAGEWEPTELVTRARYVKFPEEVALHREAARITDVMLEAGVALVTDAIAAGGQLPSEAELAAHV